MGNRSKRGPQPQRVDLGQLQLDAMTRIAKENMMRVQQLEAQVQQITMIAMSLLVGRKQPVRVTQAKLDKTRNYAGIHIDQADDGVLFSLVVPGEPLDGPDPVERAADPEAESE